MVPLDAIGRCIIIRVTLSAISIIRVTFLPHTQIEKPTD
jgi:hypothetical protein